MSPNAHTTLLHDDFCFFDIVNFININFSKIRPHQTENHILRKKGITPISRENDLVLKITNARNKELSFPDNLGFFT